MGGEARAASEGGRDARLHALVETMRAFAEATTDYPVLLETVARSLSRLIGDVCVIMLISDDGEWLCPSATASSDPESDAFVRELYVGHRLAIRDAGVTANVVRTGVPVLVPVIEPAAFAAQVAPCYAEAVMELGIHSALSVPLQVRGKIIGGLAMYRFAKGRLPFDDDDVAFASGLADHAALAISNAKLLESLRSELAERRRAKEEANRLEAQLRQAQKLEAVGRLAGGVAHDFNNLLTVILSYTTMLARALPADSPAREDVDEIAMAGERAATLTRQLLAFSRQQVLEPAVIDLSAVVRGMESIARTLITKDIELVLELDEDAGRIEADESQIGQVIANLIVNARDAMPDGGRLTLATKHVVLDAEAAARIGAAPGSYAVLVTADTGTGIDDATKPHLFEPFFTTKPKGRGTGLGLPTILGIVKQSGGQIALESEVGKGAVFEAYFPRVELPLTVPAMAPAPVSRVSGGKERILLVEDEPQVRVLIRNVLRRAGYDVLDAPDPGEALVVDARCGGDIPLLVTDVVLPGMNGRELAARFLERRPAAKVLFMSGYTEDILGPEGVLDPGVELLRKPVTPDQLLLRVRSVLDA